MKAEINNENKAKFFALYWGQDVFKHKLIIGWTGNVNQTTCHELNDGHYLKLNDLSSLTDEEYYKIFDGKENYQYQCSNGKIFHEWADNLRLKGYLVPWMGLSPNEIIESGWASYEDICLF